MQDNDATHPSDFRTAQAEVDPLEWPSQNPDLNPEGFDSCLIGKKKGLGTIKCRSNINVTQGHTRQIKIQM